MHPDAKYVNALNQKQENGARTIAKLIQRYGSAKRAWEKTAKDIDPEKELAKVAKLGVKVLTIEDKGYPKLLKEIPDAPALLYLRGEITPQDQAAVAVVGSRMYSDYGRQAAFDIARGLAQAGVTIVSGLALGIDAFAHEAALNVEHGRTIAVLAHGLDQIYPRSNTALAREIIEQNKGAVISEFPIGTPSYPSNFPIRNRIIAGLSAGTVVIEGGEKSGTLLTAQAALEYNRDVFAVPGPIYSQTSAAPNNLIKLGAKLITSAQDVLDELSLDKLKVVLHNREIIADTPVEALLLPHLGKDPVHIDKLVALSKLEVTTVSSTMVLMEMKGKVKNLGGNIYILSK